MIVFMIVQVQQTESKGILMKAWYKKEMILEGSMLHI